MELVLNFFKDVGIIINILLKLYLTLAFMPMLLGVMSFAFQFIGEIRQNQGKLNAYHNWNMMFVITIIWLIVDLGLRFYDFNFYNVIGTVLIIYPIYITVFHVVLHGKTMGFWYCGNGKGSGTEWIISTIARCNWEDKPVKYTNTSIWYRSVVFVVGSILIFI